MVNHLLRDTDLYCFHFCALEICRIWREYGVRIIPIRNADMKISFAYAVRKGRKLSREAEAFLELVKKPLI